MQIEPKAIIAGAIFVAVAIYISPFIQYSKTDWEFLYQWDDQENFIKNTMLHDINMTTLRQMAVATRINVFEPLGWLLKALIYQACMKQWDPYIIRLWTCALHFFSGFVTMLWSSELLILQQCIRCRHTKHDSDACIAANDTRLQLGCCLSATLYSLHPLFAEIVGWPSVQPYALASVFINVSIYFFVKSMCDGAQGLQSYFAFYNGLSFASYFSAVLSKSIAVSFIIAFALLDSYFFNVDTAKTQSLFRRIVQFSLVFIRNRYWHLLIFFFGSLVTLVHNQEGTQSYADVFSLDISERILKSFVVPFWSLERLIWPVRLRYHYRIEDDQFLLERSPEGLLSVAVIIAIVLLFWSTMRNTSKYCMNPPDSSAIVIVIYFICMQIPTAGILQHGMVMMNANRYVYFPALVFVPFIGKVLAFYLFRLSNEAALADRPRSAHNVESIKLLRIDQKSASAKVELRIVPTFAILIIICTLAFISRQQLLTLRTELTFYEYSLRMDPADWRLMDEYAQALQRRDACRSTTKCQELWTLSHYFSPTKSLKAKLNRIRLQLVLGHMDEACVSYTQLVDHHLDNCYVNNNAAMCHIHQGTSEQAEQLFAAAARADDCGQYHVQVLDNQRRYREWLEMKDGTKFMGSILY